MASTRKSRNASKRFAKVNEEWAEKDATPLNKNRNRVSFYPFPKSLYFDF